MYLSNNKKLSKVKVKNNPSLIANEYSSMRMAEVVNKNVPSATNTEESVVRLINNPNKTMLDPNNNAFRCFAASIASTPTISNKANIVDNSGGKCVSGA